MKTSQKAGLLYDANTVTGILSGNTLIAKPVSGHIVIYYGGWTFDQLRRFPAGEKHISREYRFDNMFRVVAPGYYRLLLPVPESSNKDWGEQFAHLGSLDRWQPAPIVIVATALVVHLAKTGKDLLDCGDNDYCRCADQSTGKVSYGFGLAVTNGRVRVCELRSTEYRPNLWLAACRKC